MAQRSRTGKILRLDTPTGTTTLIAGGLTQLDDPAIRHPCGFQKGYGLLHRDGDAMQHSGIKLDHALLIYCSTITPTSTVLRILREIIAPSTNVLRHPSGK